MGTDGQHRVQKQLQVVATCGPEQLSRAVLAFETALTAAASGVRVQLFLTLDATVWACERRRPDAGRIYDLFEQLDELGVQVTCCSACVEDLCGREAEPASTCGVGVAVASPPRLRPNVRPSGLGAFVEGVVNGVPTVTL